MGSFKYFIKATLNIPEGTLAWTWLMPSAANVLNNSDLDNRVSWSDRLAVCFWTNTAQEQHYNPTEEQQSGYMNTNFLQPDKWEIVLLFYPE